MKLFLFRGARLAAALAMVLLVSISAAETAHYGTQWNSGSGSWTETNQWSGGFPNAFERVQVHGNVVVPAGLFTAGDLEVGFNSGDHARVEVDGGQLLIMQDSLRVGEMSGGEGEFVLKHGALHDVMDVFVGGTDGVAGHATHGTLRIQGGSFIGRTLTTGVGWGARSLVSIEGSAPSAIHVFDYVYIQGFADAAGQPGQSTLSFTLDEHGVTPMTIQSLRDGLRIIHDAKSRCALEITLEAVPPREDITLVSGHVPIQGTFSDLPEGAEISAQFQNRTYRWSMSYHGGTNGNDLVLKNRSAYAADAPVTHTRPMPEVPTPLWLAHPLYTLSAAATGRPAFDGAEGFGAYMAGGRDGKIFNVDNLNDSGPGSLREAVEADGPRTIHFRVGGVIALKSTLLVTNPFMTIDGEQAPGAGILLRNHGMEVRTHDVVLRYFRIRVGDDDVHLEGAKARAGYNGGEGEHALYFTDGAQNCIADHLSLSWSTTKVLSVTKMSDLITIQWCILSEALNFADHSYASLAGGNRVTWHHNLFAHNRSRNVRFQGMVDADFRNNVIYNWGDESAYGEFDRVNYVGNYLKAGPSTTQKPLLFHSGREVVMPHSLFVSGNLIENQPKVAQDNWRGMGYYYQRDVVGAAEPFPAPAVTTESAANAFEHVLKDAGATLPKRDVTDERIVKEVRDGTGHIINWVRDSGGWPDFPAITDSANRP